MNIQEAIATISDGHTELAVDYAKQVCEAFGVEFSDRLIDRWQSEADAQRQLGGGWKGIHLTEDKPGEGVHSLRLAYHVAGKLGVTGYGDFFGRGTQARAIANAVRKHLNA